MYVFPPYDARTLTMYINAQFGPASHDLAPLLEAAEGRLVPRDDLHRIVEGKAPDARSRIETVGYELDRSQWDEFAMASPIGHAIPRFGWWKQNLPDDLNEGHGTIVGLKLPLCSPRQSPG